jgi:iron complex outermembrane receptor protein
MIEFTVGEYNRRDIKGNFNMPLTDNLFLRFSGLTQDKDGFVSRPFLSGKTGDKDSNSFIGQLRWLPSEDVTVDFLSTYTQDRSNGAPVILLKAETGQGNPARFASDVAPVLDPYINDYLFGPEFVGWDGDDCPCTDYSDTNIPQDLDTWSVALTIDWAINDDLSLKSISSYRNLESNFGRDADHLPELQNIDLFFYTEYEQWSQEFQLSGTAFDEKLDWLVGLYYYYEEGQSDDVIDFLNLFLLSGGYFETEDYAAFAHATYHVTDKLDLTLGVRYTDEEKIAIIDDDHQVVTSFLGAGEAFKIPNTAFFPVVPNGKYVEGVDETEPYLNISYHWTENLMTYASYSEGFKGGGIQVRNGPTPFLPIFGPETAEVVEIGAKWTLLDGRMYLSGAVFQTDYSDLQITANVTPPGGVPTSVVTNGGDAEIEGFEIELVALPTPNLHISAGVSVLDSEFTELNDAPGVDINNDLPNAPELQYNLSIAYDIHTERGTVTPRIDYSYSDEQFNDAENSEVIKRDETDILNLSVGFQSDNGKWSGSAFVTNALDEQVVVAGFNGGWYADGAISRPREWGLRIRRSF